MMAPSHTVQAIATEVLNRIPVGLDGRGRARVALESASLVLRVLSGEFRDPPQVDPELLALRQSLDRLILPPQPTALNPLEIDAMLTAMRVLTKTAEAFRTAYGSETLDANTRAAIGGGLRVVLAIVEGHKP